MGKKREQKRERHRTEERKTDRQTEKTLTTIIGINYAILFLTLMLNSKKTKNNSGFVSSSAIWERVGGVGKKREQKRERHRTEERKTDRQTEKTLTTIIGINYAILFLTLMLNSKKTKNNSGFVSSSAKTKLSTSPSVTQQLGRSQGRTELFSCYKMYNKTQGASLLKVGFI